MNENELFFEYTGWLYDFEVFYATWADWGEI
jgi:hypothetical protein